MQNKKDYPNTLVGFFEALEKEEISENTLEDLKQTAGAYVVGLISRNRFSRIRNKAVEEGIDADLVNAMAVWLDQMDSVPKAYGELITPKFEENKTVGSLISECAQEYNIEYEDLKTLWKMNLLANFATWAVTPAGVRAVGTVPNKRRAKKEE